MRKRILALLMVLALVFSLAACGGGSKPAPVEPEVSQEELDIPAAPEDIPEDTPEDKTEVEVTQEIILATTTSTQDSGLLDVILPQFTAETGVGVSVVSVGTGAALRMGEDGEADVLLVHDTASEEKFVADGHSDLRRDVMYNDFILVGPKDDPNGIKSEFGADINGALGKLAADGLTFVSRGDDSGTHKTELRLWEATKVATEGEWYQSVGKGMGETLQMASEQQGYTLTDRATYLKMKDNLELEIIVEGDDNLFNQYGVLVVDPSKNEKINNEGAIIFADWIVSEAGQKAIGEFVEENSGLPLFTPNAK